VGVMSSDIPKEYQKPFQNLEKEAGSLLREGHYDLAEGTYMLLINKIYDIQNEYNIRIHKGAHYYNLALAKILQEQLVESYKYNLLAYIEDVFNTPYNQEDNADNLPAARILRLGFYIIESHFNMIKNITIKGKNIDGIRKDPRNIFREFLEQNDLTENALMSLSSSMPTVENVKNNLFYNLTPDANRALQEVISSTSNRILQLAILIARNKGRSSQIIEEDIIDAIKIFERDNNV